MIKLKNSKISKQIHLEIKFSIFKFIYFKLKNKFNIRFEISKGWD